MKYIPGEKRVRRPDGVLLFHTEAALNIPGATVVTADANGELKAPVPAIPVPPAVGPVDVSDVFAALPPDDADVDTPPEMVASVDLPPAKVNVPTAERVAEIEAAVEAVKPRRGRPPKVSAPDPVPAAALADVEVGVPEVSE